MKKLYFTILSAIIGLGVNAQTLTVTNHSIGVGYIYRTTDVSSVAINPGSAGAGQSWNFSAVAIGTSTNSYTVVTTASTGSVYPGSNISAQTGTNNSFYAYTPSNYNYYGGNLQIGGFSIIITYTSAPAILAQYPMSLNSTVSNTVSGTINVGGSGGYFNGDNTTVADGTGTLTLPASGTLTARSYPNVIRVVNTQTLNANIGIAATVTQKVYDYYDISVSRTPLFTINTATISSIAGTSTQTFVIINTDYQFVGIADNAKEISDLNVYPNPAKNNITLSFTNENADNASVEIINAVGQSVRKENIGNDKGTMKHSINIESLNSGIYFVKVSVGHNTSIKKITVQ